MKHQIRSAVLSDLNDIQTVIEKSYLPFLDLIPSDYDLTFSETTITDLIIAEDKDIWVATANSDIIGVAAGITTSESIYHLTLLFVDHNFHNQGIATSLLKIFEERVIYNNYSLFTTNYQHWASWSLNFYLKNGYREFKEGDELLYQELEEDVNRRRRIGIFNTRYKRFLWKKLNNDSYQDIQH